MDSSKSPTIDLDRLAIHDFSSLESESFKKGIVIPYFKDICQDLDLGSDKKSSWIKEIKKIDYYWVFIILTERFFEILCDNNYSYNGLNEFV